ncbi:excalibur calcium-binding domain-containing protein [Streptomyces sp. NPDC003023]|uniref:excalibur calcium-binding domain-containing protein n=1 Tax=Streptomyces sp. NPDC003023 TaxID=3364675 RepID=UPI0036D0EDB2
MARSAIRTRVVPVVCVIGMAAALVGCGGEDDGADAKPVAASSSAAPTPSPTAPPKPALNLDDDEAGAGTGKEIVVEVLANDWVTPAGASAQSLENAWPAGEFTLTVDSAPGNGTAVVDGTGITYTPADGFGGEDEFTYRVATDGTDSVSATAVVRITVTKPTPTPTPTPTAKPKPKPTPKPVAMYENCDAVRAAGADPIHEGEAGFGPHLDRDGDGVGCEPYYGDGGSSGGGSGSGGTTGGGSGSTYYANCSAARAAGAAPVRVGDPGYGRHLDRDGDGVGCE